MLVHLNAILRRLHFYIFYHFFFKDGLQDNHLVGHSVMKPVDYVVSQKRRATREVKNDKSDNFKNYILDEGGANRNY